MTCDFEVVRFIKKLRASDLNLTSEILQKFAADEAWLYYTKHQKEFAKFKMDEIQVQNFVKMLEGKILQAAVLYLMEEKK